MSCSIFSMLKHKGLTVPDISSRLNVHRQSVYDSLNCKPNGSRRIRLYVSKVIGIPPSLLFSNLPPKVKLLDDFDFMNSEKSA